MSQSKHDKKIIRVFKKVGFVTPTKMIDSLQGSIWRATSKNEPIQHSVIKITDQYLHENQLSIINHQQYRVAEDILVEQSILKFLTQNEQCPKSIVKFQRFFKTNTDYYLVMEDGGPSSLFDFVMKAHKLILANKIEISHWQQVSAIIFKQMIECITYIHSKNVCHFDISLENFLINDVQIEVEHRGETDEIIRFNINDIQVKLCDFGLAELFTSNLCRTSKFCGKDNYKSPEVVSQKKTFSAKKNDIWCLGVCYFMICTGLQPWNIANESDETFLYIMKYRKLEELLSVWDINKYINQNHIQLLESIFQNELFRISLHKISQHLALLC